MASEIPNRAPNGFFVFVGSAALLVVVAGVFIGTIGATGSGGETLEQKRAAKRLETRNQLEREAQERLSTVGWVDKAKGTVHIPISEAIVQVVAELKAKKPGVSQVKVEPPLPMPVADPNSKEPPPPALPSAPQGADTIRFTYPTQDAAAPATPVPAAATPAPAPVPSPAKPAETSVPAPTPAKPAEAPAPVPPKPVEVPAPAPAPAPPKPAEAPAPAPAPVPPKPAEAPAPAPVPAPPKPAEPPAPAPASPANPIPAAAPAAPEAPSRPPIINPTENSELKK